MKNKQKISFACAGLAIGVIFVLAPLSAFAIGFAPQKSLFLSKNLVTEGDTVVIHTTVNNDGADTFVGTMKFSDESGSIGDSAVLLKTGEAGTISVSWKPLAGTHTVTAELVSKAGASVGTESESFVINAKPVPIEAADVTDTKSSGTSSGSDSTGSSTPIESSKGIQKSIAGVSTVAATYSAPLFNSIDAGRSLTASALDNGIGWSKDQLVQTETEGKTPTAKSTAKTATSTSASGINQASILKTLWTVFATIALFVLSALRYVVGNAGMFYPFLLVIFFFFLWRIFRGMRRSRY